MKMVGIARMIPDVHTFVKPIFSEGDKHFMQIVDEMTVTGFEQTSIGKEYKPMPCNISIQIGDQPLYGFELANNEHLICGPIDMSRALTQVVQTSEFTKATRGSIMRFIEQHGVKK